MSGEPKDFNLAKKLKSGPQTENGLDDYVLLLSGLDSLYVSFYLNTRNPFFHWDDLAYQREKIRHERSTKFEEITLGSETFALMPYGRHPYTYVLTNRLFEIRLGENMRPSCVVKFFSEGLWTLGLKSLMKCFEAWCVSVHMLPIRHETVSRADWAFDYNFPELDFDADCFTSRAAKDSQHRENGTVQTFTFGKGDIVVRVYDKVAEINQQSKKAFFFELWGQEINVWRIEFQVRRERLKVGTINALSELSDYQFDLLRELATHHTSLRIPSGDSNRSRWPFHPLWQRLLSDIEKQPQWGIVRDFDPTRPLEWRLHEQLKSYYGGLKSLAATLSVLENHSSPLGMNEIVERLPDLLKCIHNPIIWRTDQRQRIKAKELGL